MNTKIRLSLLNWVAAVLLALPSIASATILATNSFEDNTLGALSGQGGGSGWTGNWTAPARQRPRGRGGYHEQSAGLRDTWRRDH